jgi:hypothetical protein
MVDVRSVILCDDIRVETNGKLILVGTYSSVVVPHIPLKVQKFCVYCEIKPDKVHYDRAEINIIDPNGKIIFSAVGSYDFRYTTMIMYLYAAVTDVTFEASGEHAVFLSLDSPPELIKTFSITEQDKLPPVGT